MKFYEIKLMSIPKIKFACAVSVNNYKNKFKREENFLEITINTGGDIYINHNNGSKECFRAGMINCITQDTDCQTYADEKIRQSHITVGVDIKHQCSLHDTDNMDYSAIKGRVRNEGSVLLPYLFDLNEKYNDCVKLINIIINKNAETARKSSYNVLADWFRLAGKLTDMVTSEIEAQYTSMSPYSYRYVDLAREYISENYARRLSVDEVAAHTGISAGYLQLIFRQHLNMGVTEYINYHKVQLAKQYICGRRLSLKDISVQLGIDDPSYMSRLFKKIEGISYREYCQKYLGT